MSADFAKFDKRNYPTFDVIEGYRQGAPLYDEMVPGRLDLPLLESIRSIVWKDVEQCVDLGCGSGRIGVWLKEARGIPAIDGVDLSPDMLALAQQKNAYRSIVKGDVCDSGLESTRYDLGVSVLATCHMADLGTFYGEAARLLKRNGHFIQIDFHPFFLVNGIPTHFPKPDGSIVAIKNFVHLLSDHFNAAADVGLELSEFRERTVDKEWIKAKEKFAPYEHQPIGFMMVCRKR